MEKPKRILIVLPSWVGDAVMATPALRSLRELYPQAQISFLCRRFVKSVFLGLRFADRIIT